ncbi:MAG: hypothetical protein ACK4GJ_03790 [bacterium]
MKGKIIFIILFFVVNVLSVSFSISYRENFLINKDINFNYTKINKNSDFVYKFNEFNNIGEFNKTFNIQLFSSRKFFFFVDLKSFDALNNAQKIDFSNNFNLSTAYFSDFSKLNLNSYSYRFNLDLNTVYKLKKNIYIDFNTSFGLKETTLENSLTSTSLQLEVNPKLKVYVKF